MSPYLLLGFGFAGILHAFVPARIEGKVEECGTPDELTASNGFYKKMRDLQQNALGWNL